MTTGSFDEAKALLEEYRAGQLADARDVAEELIDRFGFTTARQVQMVMADRDLIDESLGNHWIGAIFNAPQFAWTGKWEIPEGNPRAVKNKAHDWRPIKVWTFAKSDGVFDEWKRQRGPGSKS